MFLYRQLDNRLELRPINLLSEGGGFFMKNI